MKSSTDWRSCLSAAVDSETLWYLVLSRPLSPQASAAKVTVRPVWLRHQRAYQAAERRGSQEFHENLTAGELVGWVQRRFGREYGDLHWFSDAGDFTARWKGSAGVSLKRKPPSKGPVDLAHNRPRQHLLPEGQPVPFLSAIGVMTAEGRVKPSMAHKFRQVNRYLEFLEDLWPQLPTEGVIRVVDFGCGKSYLTFALHHWLCTLHGREADIVGLDRKLEVLQECSEIAQRLHCRGLRFAPGAIQTYTPTEPVHLAISLHACDTATDDALAAAVSWNCPIILAVPCCQHELLRLLPSTTLPGLTGYGLLRERFAALATDALRARWLELHGYRTQVLEFIETEHTPKNILLRAVKRSHVTAEEQRLCRQRYEDFKRALGIETWHLDQITLED